MSVLDRQSVRADAGNRRVPRRRLEQLAAERRRPERGLRRRPEPDASGDATEPGSGSSASSSGSWTAADRSASGFRRRPAPLPRRLLSALLSTLRAALLVLLLPLQLLFLLVRRPRELWDRLVSAPAGFRSVSRRLGVASRDPGTLAGRAWEALRLSAWFVREELADMQEGMPRPQDLLRHARDQARRALERERALRLLPHGGRLPDETGERLFRAAAVGLLAGCVALGIFLSTYLAVEELKSGDELALRSIRVQGLLRVPDATLRAALPARPGDNLLELDPRAIEAALLRLPWIESVEAARDLRSRALLVRVVEHEPALLLADGRLTLVDIHGVPFKPLEPGDPSDLPLLGAAAGREPLLDPDIVRIAATGALQLLSALSSGKALRRHDVSEIRWMGDEGYLLVTRDGLPIRLARTEPAAALSRLERAVAMGALPLDAVASVDLSLRDRVVAVPRDEKPSRLAVASRVEAQPLPTAARERMLHIERIRREIGDLPASLGTP
jgi:cell division septal protein FtsQ